MSATLRALAQRARNRLRAISNSQTESIDHKSYQEACLSAKIQYAIIANKKRIEDDPLYNKVKKILSKDVDTLNPLAQLIEHSIYDNLSDVQKEKYMYKLSKRYTDIREHVLSNIEGQAI